MKRLVGFTATLVACVTLLAGCFGITVPAGQHVGSAALAYQVGNTTDWLWANVTADTAAAFTTAGGGVIWVRACFPAVPEGAFPRLFYSNDGSIQVTADAGCTGFPVIEDHGSPLPSKLAVMYPGETFTIFVQLDVDVPKATGVPLNMRTATSDGATTWHVF